MSTVYGITPEQADQFIWDWWWVAISAVFAIGWIISQIKDMFKDD